VHTLPLEPQKAPFMFNVGWDAADDFNASTFCAVHGYYRQGLANLRSALGGLTIAASFAKRQNSASLQAWLSGQSEPPKFGNARDILAPSLGPDVGAGHDDGRVDAEAGEFGGVADGERVFGGFGREVEAAGALFVAGTTAYAAVRAVGLTEGDTVVISGAAGGVGSISVQLADWPVRP
jgi:hypothetical protein